MHNVFLKLVSYYIVWYFKYQVQWNNDQKTHLKMTQSYILQLKYRQNISWDLTIQCTVSFSLLECYVIQKNYLFPSKDVRGKFNGKVQLPAEPFIDKIYSNWLFPYPMLENISKLYSLNLKVQST